MRVRPADSRAFTLLELMVVMFLISITISFAIPNIRSSLYTDELKAVARKLVGLVSEGSQQSLRQRAPYLLTYESDTRVFELAPVTGGGGDADGDASEESDKRAASSLKLPAGVRVRDITSYHGGVQSTGDLTIWISSKGYVDLTLIHLEDEDSDELTVMLSPFLGVTRVLDGYLALDSDELN